MSDKKQIINCTVESCKYNNIDTLNRLGKMINYKYRIVSLDGEILFAGGAITGGTSKGASGVINQKYELDNLKSDLIKIGHHGSSSSTSDKFLKSVNPDYAVICVGKDNSYNHPNKSVMDRLKKYGIKVYRTDEQGHITVISDGKNIMFDKSPASYNYIK